MFWYSCQRLTVIQRATCTVVCWNLCSSITSRRLFMAIIAIFDSRKVETAAFGDLNRTCFCLFEKTVMVKVSKNKSSERTSTENCLRNVYMMYTGLFYIEMCDTIAPMTSTSCLVALCSGEPHKDQRSQFGLENIVSQLV